MVAVRFVREEMKGLLRQADEQLNAWDTAAWVAREVRDMFEQDPRATEVRGEYTWNAAVGEVLRLGVPQGVERVLRGGRPEVTLEC